MRAPSRRRERTALRSSRVPAPARGATIEPTWLARSALRTVVKPLESLGESERAPILLEGLAGLAPPFEDRPEVRVNRGKIRHAHLELLELIGGLVQHGQLEVDPAQAEREREVVRVPTHGGLVERDHPGRASLGAVKVLDAGEERRGRLRLERAFPDAERLTGVTGGHMDVP